MMREIVLDTETTGLSPDEGHRVVEIGAVELNNHLPTGRTYHQYVNPQRDMPVDAFNVHGISEDFLRDKPLFPNIAQGFLDFIADAKLVIHNAAFDMRFLNAELRWADRPQLPMSLAIDTLEIARSRYPGAQNSLDALCKRLGVDNSKREKHSALLDSEILAQVYLELVGGRQPDFTLSVVGTAERPAAEDADFVPPQRPRPLPPRITEKERQAHAAFVATLNSPNGWASD